MRKKTRLIAVLVFLCIVTAAYLLISKYNRQNTQQDDTLVLKHIDAEEITSFSYAHSGSDEYDEKTYTFLKEDGIWYYADDRNFPVNQSFAAAKTKIIETVKAERVVEKEPEDIAQYGLAEPYLTVSISDGTETDVYYVGDYNASTTTYYLMVEGDKTVYLADANLFLAFDMQVWDMIDKESDPVLDADTFEKITFVFQNETIVLEREERQNDTLQPNWYLVDENGAWAENTNIAAAGQFAKKIAALSYAREVDYNYEEEEAVRYGFAAPTLKIIVEYREGEDLKEFVFTIGSESAESGIYEDVYVMSGDSKAVFTILYEDLEIFFNTTRASLLN